MPIPLTLPTIGGSYNQDYVYGDGIINYGSRFVEIINDTPDNRSTGSAGYDSASNTLFSAMNTPPDTFNKGIIDSFIRRLKGDLDLTKASTNWAELDVLVVLAQDTTQGTQAALLNWKNPGTYNSTVVNSPTWTAKQGYAGAVSASNKYLRTNFIPSTNGVKFAQQNCCMGVYNRIAYSTSATFQEAIGSFDGTNGDQLFLNQTSPNLVCGALHDTGLTTTSRNDGLLTVVNKGDQQAIYRNGNLVSYAAVATNNSRSSRELYVLARNNQGTADLHALGAQISMYFIGSAKLDQVRLYAAFQDYMIQLQNQA